MSALMYELFALRYAEREGVRGQHFLGHDETATDPHPTSYYVWIARSDEHVVMIDAGMSQRTASSLQGMRYHGTPLELMADLDLTDDDIDTVVLTHLHYDHTGMVGEMPFSAFVVQVAEWDYWHGPWAERIQRESWLRSDEDISALEVAEKEERLMLIDGDQEIHSGITVHRVGGHTAGMQIVSVATRRGTVVIASDASHFYENLEDDHPAPLLHDMTSVYGAYDRIRQLSDPSGLYLPGHDPAVMNRHPTRHQNHPHVAVIA